MLVHLLFVIFVMIALGDSVVRINNASEFIEFSNKVDRGTTYSRAIVYLDSDLSLFGETFRPIGKDKNNYFGGVFDGQGHIISDLKMNTSSQYAGLFGYLKGLTIKNAVLDSSCSITSTYSGLSNVYVGGIIGYCYAEYEACNIENSMTMVDVTFSGYTSYSYSLYLGGIAGQLYSYYHTSYMKNCANYGSITQIGKVSGWSFIGGIAGCLSGSGIHYMHVCNCLNHGTLTHNGTTSHELRIGGISGYISSVYIENCVSAGKISAQNTPSNSHIGSIVGRVEYIARISYCCYTIDVGVSDLYGMSEPTITETSTSLTTVNSALIAKLNNYTTRNDVWNKWLLNTNNASVSFIVNYGKSPTINSQIILLPDLASNNERNFSGWYIDADLTTLFNLSQVDSNTTLYGMFCGPSKYTVTLDADGGNELDESENEMVVGCMNYYGPFPENVTRTGHTFTGWFTEKEGGDKVESGNKVKTLNDHTLYAHWVINNYTVTFDFYNGTVVVDTFTYNTSIEYPKEDDMKRQGYTFNGWDESSIANMPAHNITITAQWSASNYTVAFDVIGENEFDNYTKTVTFNNSYGPLPTPSKEGHMFVGWFTDKNVSVKNESIVSIADNHTLHAHWEKVTTQVEIVFSTKDLTEKEVKEIVRKYTDAEFTITGFEKESGDIRVIIKFVGNEDAKNFVETIRESSEMDNIKKISFVPNNVAPSISPILYSFMFFNIILFII